MLIRFWSFIKLVESSKSNQKACSCVLRWSIKCEGSVPEFVCQKWKLGVWMAVVFPWLPSVIANVCFMSCVLWWQFLTVFHLQYWHCGLYSKSYGNFQKNIIVLKIYFFVCGILVVLWSVTYVQVCHKLGARGIALAPMLWLGARGSTVGWGTVLQVGRLDCW
jgi:hypothetical protein